MLRQGWIVILQDPPPAEAAGAPDLGVEIPIYQAWCQRAWGGCRSCLSLANFRLSSCPEAGSKMSDKLSAEIDNGDSHNEKAVLADTTKGDDLIETAGRRSSVALNIVENPLKVSNTTTAATDPLPSLSLPETC